MTEPMTGAATGTCAIAWYEGASGWEGLARAFVRSELYRRSPDFGGFMARLEPCGPEIRHDAWVRVAQEAPTPLGRARAYLEALAAHADPSSVAWRWLDGEFDPGGHVLHVLAAEAPRTPEAVATALEHIGSVRDEGFEPAFELEVVGASLENVRDQARTRLGRAFEAAEESIVCEESPSVAAEATAESPGEAFAELERSLPPDAELLTNECIEPSRRRHVTVLGGAAPDLQPGEHIVGQRLVRERTKGFLGFRRRPGEYELTIATSATVRITYRSKAVARYTVYRRSLLPLG